MSARKVPEENPWAQIDRLKRKWDREVERVRAAVEGNKIGRFVCLFEGVSSDGVVTIWRAHVPGVGRLEYRTWNELIAAVRINVLRRHGVTNSGEMAQTEGASAGVR